MWLWLFIQPLQLLLDVLEFAGEELALSDKRRDSVIPYQFAPARHLCHITRRRGKQCFQLGYSRMKHSNLAPNWDGALQKRMSRNTEFSRRSWAHLVLVIGVDGVDTRREGVKKADYPRGSLCPCGINGGSGGLACSDLVVVLQRWRRRTIREYERCSNIGSYLKPLLVRHLPVSGDPGSLLTGGYTRTHMNTGVSTHF